MLKLFKFITEESGQGITEYGAIIAFVAIIIGLAFSLSNGSFESAVSGTFSSMVQNLNNLVAQSSSG